MKRYTKRTSNRMSCSCIFDHSYIFLLHTVIGQIVILVRELSRDTIEKVMSKSDEQLGLEFLMGMFQDKP